MKYPEIKKRFFDGFKLGFTAMSILALIFGLMFMIVISFKLGSYLMGGPPLSDEPSAVLQVAAGFGLAAPVVGLLIGTIVASARVLGNIAVSH